MKSAGATFDQRTKRWHIDRSHPNADKKVLDFVQTSRSSVAKANRVATDPLKIDPVTGQSRLDDDYFAIETKTGTDHPEESLVGHGCGTT
ncbi:Uncharacterised protein [Exiguobacterium aurantiacum]|uniref:Uncharacterized protein n=1 Tax=Exiguobacterium aurantiacum TaxID=33987 RepID=A0A377HHK7_9BACL|nr:Uncharacterised protein [Exiguobacterium aurantiacum]